MPIHSIATAFSDARTEYILGAVAAVVLLYSVKIWAGGRKCTWERDWAGKMILIAVSLFSCRSACTAILSRALS